MGHCRVSVLQQRGNILVSLTYKLEQQKDLQPGEKKLENIKQLEKRAKAKTVKKT